MEDKQYALANLGWTRTERDVLSDASRFLHIVFPIKSIRSVCFLLRAFHRYIQIHHVVEFTWEAIAAYSQPADRHPVDCLQNRRTMEFNLPTARVGSVGVQLEEEKN